MSRTQVGTRLLAPFSPGAAYSNGFDVSLPISGNTVHTGVGFKPSAIVFHSMVTNGFSFCSGFYSWNGGAPTYSGLVNVGTVSMSGQGEPVIGYVAGGNVRAQILTLDTDRFTLTWTPAGSPTGSMAIRYMAYK